MESRKSIFNTLGSGYTMPTHDHNYKLMHGLKFGNFEDFKSQKPSQNYMSLVVDRAKSSVDPRKYTDQTDWRKKSVSRPNLSMPRKEKVTCTGEVMKIEKKKGLGPSVYEVPDLRLRILGTYSNKDDKYTY